MKFNFSMWAKLIVIFVCLIVQLISYLLESMII